jgi:uncharacterized protein (TIGR02147 family)
MKGKRALNRATIAKILNAVPINMSDRVLITQYLNAKRGGGVANREPQKSLDFQIIPEEVFYLVSDWYYLATYELFQLAGFRGTAEAAAELLGIPEKDARKALQALEQVKLIRPKPGAGKREVYIAIEGASFTTAPDVPSPWVQKKHAQNLVLAKSALEELSVDLRDFSSMVMATSPQMILHAKRRLREFRRELCKEMESIPGNQKTELFQLNLQFFKLTKTPTKRSKT